MGSPSAQSVLSRPPRCEHMISIPHLNDRGTPQNKVVHSESAVLDCGLQATFECSPLDFFADCSDVIRIQSSFSRESSLGKQTPSNANERQPEDSQLHP